MTAVPTPVMPAPVVTPAHFFGLQSVHFVFADNSGMGSLFCGRPFIFHERMRRKRRGLRTCRQRGSARGYSNGEFQKVTAFHDISPSSCMTSDAGRD